MLEWAYLTNRLSLNSVFPQKGDSFCFAGDLTQEGNLLSNLISSIPNSLPDPKIVEQSIIRLTLHEVGHTLGLNHNFKASFLHDPVSVHNSKITQKEGLTSSVMEYPAVNIAPIGTKQGDYYDVAPGVYDKWAIEFGYKEGLSEEEREKILSKSVLPELMFANDADDMRAPGMGVDPRAMINDMSNDPITYAIQRIELVNKTMEELPTKLKSHNSWEGNVNAVKLLFRETKRSLETISRYIGGVYVNRSLPSQDSKLIPLEPVAEVTQRKAMEMLSEHAFSPRAFPISSKLISILQEERRGFDFRGKHEDPPIHLSLIHI